ncbi:aspartic peptidase domain-containing protein [Xylaria flabelliformis]|nr:aspartic peptidase domain-containing protein [Xylaria flabelliformis]
MFPRPSAGAFTAALAGLASASPIQPIIGTFSVSQVANPYFKPHGPTQLARALIKYGAPISDSLAHAVAEPDAHRIVTRDQGTVSALPLSYDHAYISVVEIGTPPQSLNLALDSGSSDLWVFSTETPLRQLSSQERYNASKSQTAKLEYGAYWRIRYGDRSYSNGIVYRDTVTLGGVTVKNQAVEVALNVSRQFTSDGDTDGLLGLGFKSVNQVRPKRENTWFDNAIETLDAPVWTADLKYERPGTYDFGFINDTKYKGDLSYVDVDSSNGLWTINTSGYRIANGTFRDFPFKAIADTGTSLALLPKDIVDDYYRAVTGAIYDKGWDGYTFPCTTTPPDFILSIGEAIITIPSKYINYSADNYNHTCYGGIQSDGQIGFSILGDVFLKSAFVVFDATPNHPRLGLAGKELTFKRS